MQLDLKAELWGLFAFPTGRARTEAARSPQRADASAEAAERGSRLVCVLEAKPNKTLTSGDRVLEGGHG